MNNTEEFNATLPDMHRERSCHVAVVVKKQIYVVGGYHDATAERYDIETKKWTVIKPMHRPRSHAAAVVLGNNIVVMGGITQKGTSSSAEQYDTTSKQWSTFPSMNKARYGHAAAILNGKIIVVGGCDQRFNHLSSVEQYDPVTRRWTFLPPMIHKRSFYAAAVLDGQLYVVGGKNFERGLSSVEVYNPTTNSWSMIENMMNKRFGFAAVAWNGKLIILGGHYEKGDKLKSVEAVKIYDPKTREWSSLPSMKTPRAGHAAVVVDGTLYAIGGRSEKNRRSVIVQQLSSMESLKLQPELQPELQPKSYSKFFEKIFEKDDRNVLFKCEELMTIVEDVHQMKFLYTFINTHHCTNSINLQDCKRYITKCLEKIALSTTDRDAIAIFKQLLDKAKQDGFINNHEYYSLESKAVVAHVGAASFVKEIWKSIHGLQTRVTTLENRVDVLDVKVEGLEQVNDNIIDSIKMLQKGIRRKQKIEAVTGMMSAVLNSISFGLAGSAFQGAMGIAISNIVDFGDISHIHTVVKSISDVTVHEAFQAGIETVANRGDDALYDASRKSREILNKQDNPLFAIVVSAQLIAQAAPENNVQAQDNTLHLLPHLLHRLQSFLVL